MKEGFSKVKRKRNLEQLRGRVVLRGALVCENLYDIAEWRKAERRRRQARRQERQAVRQAGSACASKITFHVLPEDTVFAALGQVRVALICATDSGHDEPPASTLRILICTLQQRYYLSVINLTRLSINGPSGILNKPFVTLMLVMMTRGEW